LEKGAGRASECNRLTSKSVNVTRRSGAWLVALVFVLFIAGLLKSLDADAVGARASSGAALGLLKRSWFRRLCSLVTESRRTYRRLRGSRVKLTKSGLSGAL
jgi:hypothetical protein